MQKKNNQLKEGRRAAQKVKQENGKRKKTEKREKRIRRCAAQGDGTCDILSSSSHSLAGLGTAFRMRRDGTSPNSKRKKDGQASA
jgi:hypothetical protein